MFVQELCFRAQEDFFEKSLSFRRIHLLVFFCGVVVVHCGTVHVGETESDGRNRAFAAAQKAEVRSGLLSDSVRHRWYKVRDRPKLRKREERRTERQSCGCQARQGRWEDRWAASRR